MARTTDPDALKRLGEWLLRPEGGRQVGKWVEIYPPSDDGGWQVGLHPCYLLVDLPGRRRSTKNLASAIHVALDQTEKTR